MSKKKRNGKEILALIISYVLNRDWKLTVLYRSLLADYLQFGAYEQLILYGNKSHRMPQHSVMDALLA
jgi:hypothetical protein